MLPTIRTGSAQSHVVVLVASCIPLLAAAPVHAGDFDGWGVIFQSVEASFADCKSYDVTKLRCEDLQYVDVGIARPVYLWLVAYHGSSFYDEDIESIRVSLGIDPYDAEPTWITCGWSEAAAPGEGWVRDFVPIGGGCVTPQPGADEYTAYAPLGFFTLPDHEIIYVSSFDSPSYWTPCGSETLYQPCSGIGSGYSVDESSHETWIGTCCVCAPAVELATWGRIKAAFGL